MNAAAPRLARRTLLLSAMGAVALIGFTLGVLASNPAYGPNKYWPSDWPYAHYAYAYIDAPNYGYASLSTCVQCYPNALGYTNGYFQRLDSSWLNLQSGWPSIPYSGHLAVVPSGLYTRIQTYVQVQNPVGSWGPTSSADTAY